MNNYVTEAINLKSYNLNDADKIIVIDNGSVKEIGTHQELMANKGWYFEQYQKQLMGGEGNE